MSDDMSTPMSTGVHTGAAPPTGEPESTRSGRHPVDVGHLVMGIAFLGLAGLWALVESGTVGRADLDWLLPVPWLAAGAAGLLATWARSRRAT